ncbi:hypothetical protein QJS10_CPB19g00102 [Acorus calamus]|uniref:Uncharacterized protein n=1 Tax=Acorus calamus TaxID=4465 RepID=A0AAV9CFV2_ACOCL|nr:hypothetical protein QJS10_CPB19g00102 [Acorus calamus]
MWHRVKRKRIRTNRSKQFKKMDPQGSPCLRSQWRRIRGLEKMKPRRTVKETFSGSLRRCTLCRPDKQILHK